MISRKAQNASKFTIIILLCIVLAIIFIHNEWFTAFIGSTPTEGEIRITQNIIIHSYEPTNYTITTSLLYFDGENWKDLSTWERDVPISKISATKAYLQSKAEKRQRLVEAAIKEFYK